MKSASFFLPALVLTALHAQTIDTGILGEIRDPTGATIAAATVTILQPTTGLSKTVTSDSGGHYEVRYLIPGDYTVEVKAPGFRTERLTGIVIQIGQQARIDFAMQVGDVVETLEVNSAAPLLQTENSTLGEVVGPERIVNLPLNGRNFAQLAVLTPGVRVVAENAVRTDVVANGARDINMQVSFDGITVVNNRHNFVVFYPSVDAIQEFKVQSGNYSAEYGGNAGANVSVQLRSGTTSFTARCSTSCATTSSMPAAISARRPSPKTFCGAISSAACCPDRYGRTRHFFSSPMKDNGRSRRAGRPISS